MPDEVIAYLDVTAGGLYVDCTLGGGGHTRAILERGGTVIGIDRDPDAVDHARRYLFDFQGRFFAQVARFSAVVEVARRAMSLTQWSGSHPGAVDGVLMDLGVSSKMVDDPSKGFSYRLSGPLLMNMGCGDKTAYDIVNGMPVHELSSLILKFGEERKARTIARAIERVRSSHPIETTVELAGIIEKAVGSRMPQKSKARVFQALRIAVNDELDELHQGLDGALELLKPRGRLCVISYHSLEDRAVKNFLREQSGPCICPPDLPVCRCGRQAMLRIITKKAVKPSSGEIERNPRARSARLRAAEKAGAV